MMNVNKAKKILAAAVFSTALAICAQTAPAAPAPAAKAPAAPAPAPQKQVSATELLSFLPDTVAELNGVKLTKTEMIDRLNAMKLPLAQISTLPNYRSQLKQMAEGMLVEKIMLNKAAAAGFKPSADGVKAEVLKQFNALPKEQQEMVLKQSKKDINALAAEISSDPLQQQNFALKNYFDSQFKAKLDKLTDADAVKFYNDNKEKLFKNPETVSTSHILILANGTGKDGKKLSEADAKKQDAEAKKKIEEIRAKVVKGEDFGKLAEEFSDCPSGKANKGALRPFSHGDMVPEFEKAAFALQNPGDISPVVKTGYGYHIIKLAKKNPAGYIPLDDSLKSNIKQNIAGEAINKDLQAELETLKKSIKTFGFPEPVPAPAAAPAPAAKTPAAAPAAK